MTWDIKIKRDWWIGISLVSSSACFVELYSHFATLCQINTHITTRRHFTSETNHQPQIATQTHTHTDTQTWLNTTKTLTYNRRVNTSSLYLQSVNSSCRKLIVCKELKAKMWHWHNHSFTKLKQQVRTELFDFNTLSNWESAESSRLLKVREGAAASGEALTGGHVGKGVLDLPGRR